MSEDKKKNLYLFRVMAFLVGVMFFVTAVENFGGFSEVFYHLRSVGWGYLFVILNSFLWMLGYTQAWRLYFAACYEIGYFSLLKVKLCGEAVNFMTPLGFILGDSVRVLLLRKYLGPEARLRSIVIDRTTHILAAQIFCFIGFLLIFTQDIVFPFWLHITLMIIYFFIIVVLLSLIFELIHGKGLGFFEPVFRWLKIAKRFPAIDSHISRLRDDLEFYQDKPKKPFLIAFFYHFFSRCLGAVEILIIVWFFQHEFLPIFSVILIALSAFVGLAFSFIPGALGIQETMYAHFFSLYGFLPETGLTLQIVRRLRSLFWIFVGILIMDFAELKDFLKRLRKPSHS